MKNLVYNTNMELKEIACEIAKKIQECGAKKVDVLDVTARTNQIKYMIFSIPPKNTAILFILQEKGLLTVYLNYTVT